MGNVEVCLKRFLTMNPMNSVKRVQPIALFVVENSMLSAISARGLMDTRDKIRNYGK
jgi:hypothetical protein